MKINTSQTLCILDYPIKDLKFLNEQKADITSIFVAIINNPNQGIPLDDSNYIYLIFDKDPKVLQSQQQLENQS